jgi:hypothetical protein
MDERSPGQAEIDVARRGVIDALVDGTHRLSLYASHSCPLTAWHGVCSSPDQALTLGVCRAARSKDGSLYAQNQSTVPFPRPLPYCTCGPYPRRPSAKPHCVCTLCGSEMCVPSFVTVAIWN